MNIHEQSTVSTAQSVVAVEVAPTTLARDLVGTHLCRRSISHSPERPPVVSIYSSETADGWAGPLLFFQFVTLNFAHDLLSDLI